MNAPTPEAVQRLIDAATALIEARTDHMVTIVEWRNLRDAVVACGGTARLEDEDVDDAVDAVDA